MVAAVQQDRQALRHASADLRKDMDLVLTAVRANPNALRHAHQSLQGDAEVVMAAVCREDVQGPQEIFGPAFRVLGGWTNGDLEAMDYADPELQDDPDFLRALVKRLSIGWCGSALQISDSRRRKSSWRRGHLNVMYSWASGSGTAAKARFSR